MNEQTEFRSTDESDLEEIVAALDCVGVLPKEALRQAQQRRAEITPRLIELLRNATAMARCGEVPAANGHFFALFLLAEFQAKDAEFGTALVMELASYGAHEAIDDIREAFQHGLVDEWFISLGDVERSFADGEARFRDALKHCPQTGVQDTIEHLSGWAAFRERKVAEASPSVRPPTGRKIEAIRADEWADAHIPAHDESPVTIRKTGLRVGRNDPCPCGSGKKLKKCCGAKR